MAEFRPHTTELFHSVGHLMGKVATLLLPLLFQIPIQICRGILIKLRKLSKNIFHQYRSLAQEFSGADSTIVRQVWTTS